MVFGTSGPMWRPPNNYTLLGNGLCAGAALYSASPYFWSTEGRLVAKLRKILAPLEFVLLKANILEYDPFGVNFWGRRKQNLMCRVAAH